MSKPYRVEAIALHEVGVFDDIRLDFKPIAVEDKGEIHIFTGPNGCGKSTLLYAIAEIFCTYNPKFTLISQRFRDSGENSYVEFMFAERTGYYATHKPKAEWLGDRLNPIFIKSTRELMNDITSSKYFALGGANTGFNVAEYGYHVNAFESNKFYLRLNFSFSAFAYSGQRYLRDVSLRAIQQINNSPFEAALSFDNTARPQILLQWIANNRTQAALARQDKDEAAATNYDEALARITNFVHEICDLEIEFRLQRSPLAVNIRVNSDTIHFDGLPDGLKSIISWVADLSLRLEAIPWENPQPNVFLQPVILLLDEVDIHLHPKWQRRILPAIQKLLPNSQIFVSTHSPFVVGSVEDAWVYRLPEPGSYSGPITVEGIPSAAGKSYRLILEEVFGIDEEFDVETEELFAAFYEARNQFIKAPEHTETLLQTAQKLAARGEESAQIVARELRQVSRITGKELPLA